MAELDTDLLDALVLTRAIRGWLVGADHAWEDGVIRNHAISLAGAAGRSVALALAESTPEGQQEHIVVAGSRAGRLRGEVELLAEAEDSPAWTGRVDDLCDALLAADLARLEACVAADSYQTW